MTCMRDAWVEIDTQKLKNNFLSVKNAVGPAVKVCAVLKAQCYGMRGDEVARIFWGMGADMFAVATLSEALEIRSAVPEADILVMGYVSFRWFDVALGNGVTLGMSDAEQLRAFAAAARRTGRTGKVHIAVNTGLNRLGFAPTAENADDIAAAAALPGLALTGLYTHFSDGDDGDKTVTNAQMARFDAFAAMLRARGVQGLTVHVACSPVVCDMPPLYRDMVRPGLIFTGQYASDEVSRDRVHAEPCVRLKCRLEQVKTVPAGDYVSYGFGRRLELNTLVGTLPIGFSDGFTRSFSDDFYVMVRGRRCPVIGKICMDHCMVDLSAVPEARVDDEVIVYGDGTDGAVTIEQAAARRGTIVDEVLTNLSARLPRIFV